MYSNARSGDKNKYSYQEIFIPHGKTLDWLSDKNESRCSESTDLVRRTLELPLLPLQEP